MIYKRFYTPLVFILSLLLLSPVKATPIRLSDIETYLNALDNVVASIEQWDANGAYQTGQLFLQKPGKLRLNYDKPSQLVILGDGEMLFFADRGTGDLSYMPIQNSPASFLLSKQIDIQNNFRVSNFTFDKDIISLTLHQKGDHDIGSLTLIFSKTPTMTLKQWIITDPQGKKVIVKLNNLRSVKKLTPQMFDSSLILP